MGLAHILAGENNGPVNSPLGKHGAGSQRGLHPISGLPISFASRFLKRSPPMHRHVPEGLVQNRSLVVEWGECDPLGIIFYPTYFRYFDQSTHRLLALARHTMASLRRDYGLAGPVIVDASAKFMKPVTHGDELRAQAFVAEWRTRVFKVAHRVFRGSTLVCEGHELRAWALVDEAAESGFAAGAIPDEFKARFAA
jgi:acyl-CoA thioesterase FadM